MTETERLQLRLTAPSQLGVVGGVDESELLHLRRVLLAMLEEGGDLVVDLNGVCYLPSAAIGMLVLARARARREGASLTLLAERASRAGKVLTACGVGYRQKAIQVVAAGDPHRG